MVQRKSGGSSKRKGVESGANGRAAEPEERCLIINAEKSLIRVAYLENGRLTELHIEQPQSAGTVGNIYKGKVVRVLPGMSAAFVDIGLDKAAFLHSKDLASAMQDISGMFDVGDDDEDRGRKRSSHRIEDHLKENQQIIVQVSKPSIGNKGARITQAISLPGRYAVYMPSFERIGVSRKIESPEERKRLRKAIADLKYDGGFIIRTAAEGVSARQLQSEAKFLVKLWDSIKRKARRKSAPVMLHQDLDVMLKMVRDLMTGEMNRLIVDDPSHHKRILKFISSYAPELKKSVELYKGDAPIFEAFHIEEEIERALSRKVWLKSGGYILIDPTEALTAIDVNTGRYVGKKNQDETILKTNLEAVEEIVYQLRLRNIGGIIIIDFIDMAPQAHRQKVYEALEEALKSDRNRSRVLQISKLGLVEMTRKRTSKSLLQSLTEPCPCCEGRGRIKSRAYLARTFLHKVEKQLKSGTKGTPVLRVNPRMAEYLRENAADRITEIERAFKVKIGIQEDPSIHVESVKISFT